MARLPTGEESIPLIEVEGQMLSLEELREKYPDRYQQFMRKLQGTEFTVSDELLIERVRKRTEQGRVPTVHHMRRTLTPEEQIAHMEAGDEIGQRLLEAERKLLEAEYDVLRG